LSTSLLSKNIKIKIYRTILLSFVVYGCETWSLILRDQRRLRVFENRVLRRLLGPTWDEVKSEWKKLYNEKLNDLYCSPNVIWVNKSGRMRLAGHVVPIGEESGVHRDLVGKLEGKRPLGRSRRRWKDNINTDLQEVEWRDVEWINLAQDRDSWRALVNAVMNLWVP